MAPNYQLIFALVDVDEQLQMQRSKLGGLLGSELMLVHGLGNCSCCRYSVLPGPA